MNEVGEKYLPLGSVVILKGATKKIMITGFACVSSETGDKEYDYSGCMYPEGFFNYSEVCVFDHDKIEKVVFKGYHDEEAVKFHEVLNKRDN
jgi:hypothetical protein